MMPVDGSGLARMIVEKPLVAPAARPLRLLPRHAVGAVLRRARRPQPPAQHHRRRRDPGPEGAEGVLLCQGTAAGGYALLRQGRQAALRPQLRGPERPSACASDSPLHARQARAAVRVRADRGAGHAATVRVRPGGSSSTSTAPWSATRRSRTPRRSPSTRAR